MRRIGIEVISFTGFSRGMARLADLKLPGPMLRRAIRRYIKAYDVDMSEVESSIDDFKSFDAFFTRSLRDGARPVEGDVGDLVACADGHLSIFETTESGTILQAKGHRYALSALLGDDSLAAKMEGGTGHTIYLSPRDYHRVHSPLDGAITRVRYIPGRLFPVFPYAVQNVDDLFCRNERVVIELDTASGPAAVVMVGASFVGRISLSFLSKRSNDRFKRKVEEITLDTPIEVVRGEELGMFHLGSTVVVAQAQQLSLESPDILGGSTRMGMLLAKSS
jgi:phosphatidylserine decarboxylase